MSALWNETPDNARVLTMPCAICSDRTNLTEPHDFDIIIGAHRSCLAGLDYCANCLSSGVWDTDGAPCPHCGNDDQGLRMDWDSLGHAQAEERAGFRG